MRFGKLSYGMELLPYRYRLPGNFRRAKNSGQSLSSGYRSDLRGSSLYVENLSALQCHRNTAQAPICLQELWLQSAQRPQCWSESATSGLSADNSGAGVNKPYVEPALAGDNKAFDFSRELFTSFAMSSGVAVSTRISPAFGMMRFRIRSSTRLRVSAAFFHSPRSSFHARY